MKINPQQNFIKFKSQNVDDEKILGYDDEPSQNARNAIREWHETYFMPYQSIYEKEPRLTEYQLSRLLKPLTNKPKVIDYKTIMGLPVANLEPIDSKNNSFRGASLVNKSECLPILKKSGIERVIDLVGYSEYEQETKSAGLEYYCPQFGGEDTNMYLWAEPAFFSREEYVKDGLRRFSFVSKNNFKSVDKANQKFQEESRKSIDKFVDMIQVLQKGNFYIGCQYGTYRTSDYLLLNQVFNPKAEVDSDFKLKDVASDSEMYCMLELYDKLTPEDKQKMGWTEEFDKKVYDNLMDM